jgi:hypothetical protein
MSYERPIGSSLPSLGAPGWVVTESGSSAVLWDDNLEMGRDSVDPPVTMRPSWRGR